MNVLIVGCKFLCVVLACQTPDARISELLQRHFHRRYTFWKFFGEVGRFARIVDQIKQQRLGVLLQVGKQLVTVVHKCHLRGSSGCIGIGASESLKGDRHWALHHLALDQWQQTDAVWRLGLTLGHQAQDVQGGRVVIECTARNRADRAGLDGRWPFEQSGHVDTSLPKTAFPATKCTGRAAMGSLISAVAFGSVVACKPKHGVLRDTQITKFSAQASDLLVQRGDGSKKVLLTYFSLGIQPPKLRTSNDGFMRCMEPDHGQEWLFIADRLADERNGAIHQDSRIAAFQILSG